MRKCLLVLSGFAFALPPFSVVTNPQSLQASPNESFQNRDPQNDVGVPTLRVTTREVLVDLIALDRHNQPVLDLKPAELQVSAPEEQQTKKKGKRRWQILDGNWFHRADYQPLNSCPGQSFHLGERSSNRFPDHGKLPRAIHNSLSARDPSRPRGLDEWSPPYCDYNQTPQHQALLSPPILRWTRCTCPKPTRRQPPACRNLPRGAGEPLPYFVFSCR